MNKSMAVFFLLVLVVVPLTLMLKQKTLGKKLESVGKADLIWAYGLVLLATMLFNH